MKTPLNKLNALLALAAIVLTAANIFVVMKTPAAAARANSPPPTLAASPSTPAPVQSQVTNAQPAALPFVWSHLESDQYPAYIDRLRSTGFPEELIREIIIADVNQLYAPRIAPLMPGDVPFDAPRRPHGVNPTDHVRLQELQNILIEKQQVLQSLLGARVPRELARLSNEINYDAYEYAIRSMPPEKQDAVQKIQEDLWIRLAREKFQPPEGLSALDAYSAACDDRSRALSHILTREEFEQFYMLSAPVGSELARRTIGMEPTNEEMLEMYRIADDHWTRTGGVHGKWRARPVPASEIAAADAEMNARLQEALGPDRFLDYQMAVSEVGQRLKNLGTRYNLPRETLADLFSIQTEIDRVQKALSRSVRLPELSADLSRQLADLQSRAAAALGPELWQTWNQSRNMAYDLNPE